MDKKVGENKSFYDKSFLIRHIFFSGDGWPYGATIDSATEMGAEVEELESDQVCADEDNKIVSAPLFMNQDARFDQVAGGADNLVEALFGML